MTAETASSVAFQAQLKADAAQVADFLARWLTDTPRPLEAGRPHQLIEAMRYAVLNGGKRFRPFLALETASMIGGPTMRETAPAMHVAAALECIHCYSLVHDDLPAMDDDDLRRGKPTVHKAYDEATAILAGDGLQAEAFTLLAHPENHIDAEIKWKLVEVLARDSGIGGMVGGQSFDLQNEHKIVSETAILQTQALKTGALIRAGCEMGALVGGGSAQDCAVMRRYGDIIGLTFQIADDVLDLTADTQTLGKRAGKDEQAGKQTLVSMHGLDWARAKLDELVDEAVECLAPFGARAGLLRQAAQFVAYRAS